MKQQLEFALVTAGLALALFLGMLFFLELGRRLRVRRIASQHDDAGTGVGVVDGAVYGLLALLIGFMFSGAAARFDQRRELIAQEANAMRTAWQRVDLLPAEPHAAMRAAFRRYVDVVIDEYTNPADARQALHASPAMLGAQNALWGIGVAAALDRGGDPSRPLLLPALNLMFDAADRERFARRIHPPLAIFAMLGLTALAAALFAGYGLAGSPARHWIYIIGFAATTSIATSVIIELEYPRLGLIRVDEMDQMLVELRATMK